MNDDLNLLVNDSVLRLVLSHRGNLIQRRIGPVKLIIPLLSRNRLKDGLIALSVESKHFLVSQVAILGDGLGLRFLSFLFLLLLFFLLSSLGGTVFVQDFMWVERVTLMVFEDFDVRDVVLVVL